MQNTGGAVGAVGLTRFFSLLIRILLKLQNRIQLMQHQKSKITKNWVIMVKVKVTRIQTKMVKLQMHERTTLLKQIMVKMRTTLRGNGTSVKQQVIVRVLQYKIIITRINKKLNKNSQTRNFYQTFGKSQNRAIFGEKRDSYLLILKMCYNFL